MNITINCREAHIMPDGSGFVSAKRYDHPWQLVKDILKFQGIAQPRANEILSLYRTMTRLNGRDWVKLREGQVVDFPANSAGVQRRDVLAVAQQALPVG